MLYITDLSCQAGVHGRAAWSRFRELSFSLVGETRFGMKVLENRLTLDILKTKALKKTSPFLWRRLRALTDWY